MSNKQRLLVILIGSGVAIAAAVALWNLWSTARRNVPEGLEAMPSVRDWPQPTRVLAGGFPIFAVEPPQLTQTELDQRLGDTIEQAADRVAALHSNQLADGFRRTMRMISARDASALQNGMVQSGLSIPPNWDMGSDMFREMHDAYGLFLSHIDIDASGVEVRPDPGKIVTDDQGRRAIRRFLREVDAPRPGQQQQPPDPSVARIEVLVPFSYVPAGGVERKSTYFGVVLTPNQTSGRWAIEAYNVYEDPFPGFVGPLF